MWGHLVEAAFPTPKRPPLCEETQGCDRGTAREHGGQHPSTGSGAEEATKVCAWLRRGRENDICTSHFTAQEKEMKNIF